MAALHFAKSDVPFEDVILLLVSDPSDLKINSISGVDLANMTGDRRIAQMKEINSSGKNNNVFPLRISDANNLNALCIYLTEKLRIIPNTAKAQRTMVCTWLCELYLQRIAMADLASTTNSGGQGNAKESLLRSVDVRNATDDDELVNQFKDFIRSNRYLCVFDYR